MKSSPTFGTNPLRAIGLGPKRHRHVTDTSLLAFFIFVLWQSIAAPVKVITPVTKSKRLRTKMKVVRMRIKMKKVYVVLDIALQTR